MAQILDTGAEITTAAMCLWEVLLQIRSNNPRDAIEKAMNAVYTRHGTCEMRNVMAEFAEDCDREHHQAAVAKTFDGSFDWEWCPTRSEEHTSELQSLMRISYAVFCLKKKKHITIIN